jgi:hypothetical protein
VRRNGTVSLDETQGLFEYRLTPQRLVRLKETVSAAGLSSLKDDYPSRYSNDDHEWVCLTVMGDDGREKRVRSASESPEYPEGLRRLFDLRLEGMVREHDFWHPGGALYPLIAEARQHPIAAVTVRVKVPKTSYRVNEPIEATIVVKNIGTKPVFAPSLDTPGIARGWVDARLLFRPSRSPWVADTAGVDFGIVSWAVARHDAPPQEEIRHLVRIAPGAT